MRAVRAAAAAARDGRDPGRAAVARAGRRDLGRAGQGDDHDLRATGTATATACRSTAPRARPARASASAAIAEFYYPGTSWGEARARCGSRSRPTPPTTSSSARGRGLTLRDTGAGERTRLPANGATRWRISLNRKKQDRVQFYDGRWRNYRRLEGQGSFRAGRRRSRWSRRPATAPTAAGWSRPRPVVGRTPGTRSTCSRSTATSRASYPLEMPATRGARPPSGPRRSPPARTRRTSGRTAAARCATPRRARCTAGTPPSTPRPTPRWTRPATSRSCTAGSRRSPSSRRAAAAGRRPARCPTWRRRRIPTTAGPGNAMHAWTTRVQDGAFESAWPAIGNLQPDRRAAARRQRRVGRPRRVDPDRGRRGPGHGQWRHAAQCPRPAIDLGYVRGEAAHVLNPGGRPLACPAPHRRGRPGRCAAPGVDARGGAGPTSAPVRDATIVGTNGDDRLAGTNGRDVVVARGGDDVVSGFGGNDLLCGNAGADVLEGGRGADALYGGGDRLGDDVGRQVPRGRRAPRRRWRRRARRWLGRPAGRDPAPTGHVLVDRCAGRGHGRPVRQHRHGHRRGVGTDRIRIQARMGVEGSAYADTIRGSDGADALHGLDGNDRLIGDGGDDQIYGESRSGGRRRHRVRRAGIRPDRQLCRARPPPRRAGRRLHRGVRGAAGDRAGRRGPRPGGAGDQRGVGHGHRRRSRLATSSPCTATTSKG